MSSAKEPVIFKPNTTYVLQECLEHDQTTVNQMCNKATQLDNRKFIHEPKTIVLNKTTALAALDERWSMQTIILVL